MAFVTSKIENTTSFTVSPKLFSSKEVIILKNMTNPHIFKQAVTAFFIAVTNACKGETLCNVTSIDVLEFSFLKQTFLIIIAEINDAKVNERNKNTPCVILFNKTPPTVAIIKAGPVEMPIHKSSSASLFVSWFDFIALEIILEKTAKPPISENKMAVPAYLLF
ncbi:MAG: hypothetical protein RR902_04265, partial [Oscillospiraceae bacterium]